MRNDKKRHEIYVSSVDLYWFRKKKLISIYFKRILSPTVFSTYFIKFLYPKASFSRQQIQLQTWNIAHVRVFSYILSYNTNNKYRIYIVLDILLVNI